MKDNKLFELVKAFVFRIYPLIQPAIDKKYFKPNHDKYPRISYNENGMPTITNYGSSELFKVSEVFNGWEKDTNIKIAEYEEYNMLLNYLLDHKE